MSNTYWNKKGKYEDLAQKCQSLYPKENKPSQYAVVRQYSNIASVYYDIFNNGGGNLEDAKFDQFNQAMDIAAETGSGYETEQLMELLDWGTVEKVRGNNAPSWYNGQCLTCLEGGNFEEAQKLIETILDNFLESNREEIEALVANDKEEPAEPRLLSIIKQKLQDTNQKLSYMIERASVDYGEMVKLLQYRMRLEKTIEEYEHEKSEGANISRITDSLHVFSQSELHSLTQAKNNGIGLGNLMLAMQAACSHDILGLIVFEYERELATA